MPVSLGQLTKDSAKVTFACAGDTMTLEYYPSRVTEDTFLSMQNFQATAEADAAQGFRTFNEMLVNLIKDWDFYEDAECTQKVPIDADRFRRLPLGFLVQCLQAILGDIRPETIAPQ